jgi:kynureninase
VTRQDAERLDAADPLAAFRERFVLPVGVIYLDGNSLGALPRETARRVAEVVNAEWGQDLIKSWNLHGWIDLPRRVGAKIARLVGAEPNEVLVADSTSVNLFKLLAGALRLQKGRPVILSEANNFPTDLYIAQGLIELLGGGYELRTVPRDQVLEALDARVAVLMLTQVDYRSGALWDLAAVTERAHAVGALVLWDLAHSAGALPVDLNGAGADLAVGCGYKYLNGGPGAPAFLYAARRLQEKLRTPLSGWLGHAAPFAFEPEYRPGAGIDRFLCGTPPILSLAALECGVDLTLQADLTLVRKKSLALGELFLDCVQGAVPEFALASPVDPNQRGSQVSLRHPEGYAIVQALIARGVIGDFRAPDVLRFGFAPLYTRYVDVWEAVTILAEIMATRAWDQPEYRVRRTVT